MDKSREELEKEYAEATAKLEQYQHRGQRYENRIRYYTQGERKKRNHRLITRGGAVESIAPEVRGMSERAFFSFNINIHQIQERFIRYNDIVIRRQLFRYIIRSRICPLNQSWSNGIRQIQPVPRIRQTEKIIKSLRDFRR